MASMIRFGVQGHRAGLPRDFPSTAFSSGSRTKLGSGTALRFLRAQAESAYLRRRALRVSCSKSVSGIVVKDETVRQHADGSASGLSIVMKFGGSSVSTADRIREVAELILTFPEESPVIVLSAMGKTTNNLLLAGEKAVTCGVSNASDISELKFVKQLHLKTINELGIDGSTISVLLDELEQLLKGIAMMKELTPRTRDYLVSFGECMSTRIFAEYLTQIGVKARQYDAFDIGFITTDDFTNADILEATFPAIAKRLHGDWISDPAIPIVTGFLGKGWKSCAVTTLGRGGSDLTATTIGKALGLREIQVWKDVDGVLTCDPNIYSNARPVPFLTFEEAAELAYFGAQVLHPQSMRPARESDIPVRVKNSYNPKAPGTLITKERDMSEAVLTSIVLKSNITMLDIVSTRMLGQYGFLAKVFSIFEDLGISVDSVATSEVSVSLTLDPSKLWSRELIQQELDHVVEELEKIAVVHLLQHRSIISLIGNVQRSSLILEKVFNVLRMNGVNVQMISQGASKVNISLVVNDSEAKQCVKALHSAFFENGFISEAKEDLHQNGLAKSALFSDNGY
ncbi:aspartokinase 2, chloroplastic [Dendrobium catenatum]|uniref:aspartate kinase n=1 Tax=Dendrobium catenatum TaxID=906689 RepID=A0A2I0WHE7_9ASPA|nr:aspartokinase 2, chloroplastic [Dendrobium catenatum]XP_020683189.1 aspartokinase 2, chloroplastic [Dendrobium catenatum]XP_020683190.1 aspartokinase 2, chloroplastic [Dendrobium catenatum]XP_020683191.1 aspartokinase 2, chloroplastic [Dendrobium catenatum]XP_020683192.1 aspartokinase 2, chloroplastic [Dendrobium catenatum]XP_028552548.1 aspartokinase 2, chloroplastic [Dendrobium catenatum]PKU75093.1 Aspartokinase 1, chloroplastic [Dendrobium catenatum]